MKRLILLFLIGVFLSSIASTFAQTRSSTNPRATVSAKHKIKKSSRRHHVQRKLIAGSQISSATVGVQASTLAATGLPQFTQNNISFAPFGPLMIAVDPYANATSSADGLKPARPFWYAVDRGGLTILRIDDNKLMYRIPWPQFYDMALPEGDDLLTVNAPSSGWEPVGMLVSYPTEEALASTSETPATYVFVVMARSGYQWASNPNPPDLRDPGLRDTIVAATSPETESSVLLEMDVTDPTFSPDTFPAGPTWVGALLGHKAGQMAFEPSMGNVYVANMPSLSLPTSPRDLTSFVSVVMPIAVAEGAAAEPASGAPPDLPLVLCGPEHPDEGLAAGSPYVWPCVAEGGEATLVWEFTNLPTWVTAHRDKLTQELDGILYGTPPSNGVWTFQARVTDLGENPGVDPPNSSEWTTVTLNVVPTAVWEAGEVELEAGVPGGAAIAGTGNCTPAPTSTPGSMVPRWLDVQTAMVNGVVRGCYVMGTAPISGEYYEFAFPGFTFDGFPGMPVVFSGNVLGTYMFDPLPQGVGLSGLAWHEIDKIHDPSTEADILNQEMFGVEPFTGQLYRILLPQGTVGEVAGPPETANDIDEIDSIGVPMSEILRSSRSDIADALTANPNLRIRFGDLVVEASRDPRIYVSATEMVDPTGVDSTIIPIGGPAGSSIDSGALMKVSGTRPDPLEPTTIAWSAPTALSVTGVQARYISLDSNLSPAVRDQENGQVDNGLLWVAGSTSGTVGLVDTASGEVAATLAVNNAASLAGLSVDFGTRSGYVAVPAGQNVTMFATGSAVGPRAPTIWAGETATFTVGQPASFPIATTGSPTPSISLVGELPSGVTLVDHGDGTATLAGTPAEGTGNDYTVTLVAQNGVSPDANLAMIITVVSAPTITSGNTATFVVGLPNSFAVTTTGAASLLYVSLSGDVPSWLTLTTDEATGMSTLDGTPPNGSEGTYRFTITASTGTPPDAVQAFTLNVVPPDAPYAPSVLTQPLNQRVAEGQAATFTAAANGYPAPSVLWQVSNDGSSWAEIAGANSSSHTTVPTTMSMTGQRFRAVFSNSVGSATTLSATLSVTSPLAPSITLNPSNISLTEGQTATFTAAASGDPTPSVQWQLSTNLGINWTDIAGASGASYTTSSTTMSMDGNRYRAVFTNTSGNATSNGAILTVTPAQTAPAVVLQPFAQSVNVGQPATFMADASGNPPPSIQWQQSTDSGVTWVGITGAIGTSYSTPATTVAMSGYRYRAVFTNVIGSATSNAAVLTVNAAPAITTNPSSQTVLVGQAASFTAAASGNPRPTVQWQLSTNGGTSWSNIGGATSTTYTTAATTLTMNGYRYRAVFTNVLGNVTTGVATLVVQQAPAITSANTITFTVGQAGSFLVTTTGSPTPNLSSWGTLPSGVTFTDNGNGTGTLAGTPASGSQTSYQISVTAANGVNPDALQYFTLNVNVPQGIAPAFTSASTTTFTTGTAGSFTVRATGTPTPSLSVFGVLPSGVTFTDNGNGTGTLAGVPASGSSSSYPFIIMASNGVGSDAYQFFNLTVNPATVQSLAIATTSLPEGRTGQAYSQTLQASGGTAPYRWAISSGNLPRGLTLSQSGVISGTPTRTGNSTFSVRVTDAQSRTTTKSLSIRIR